MEKKIIKNRFRPELLTKSSKQDIYFTLQRSVSFLIFIATPPPPPHKSKQIKNNNNSNNNNPTKPPKKKKNKNKKKNPSYSQFLFMKFYRNFKLLPILFDSRILSVLQNVNIRFVQ